MSLYVFRMEDANSEDNLTREKDEKNPTDETQLDWMTDDEIETVSYTHLTLPTNREV